MKKYIIICLLLLTFSSVLPADDKARFFIATSAAGDSSGRIAEPYLAYFETNVFNLLQSKYPCVVINSSSTVKALLDHERERQLLGSGDDNAISNIGQSLGCKYLISLKVSVMQNTAIVTAFCMDQKEAKVLSRSTGTAQHGGAALDAVEKVSQELIDGLKYYEICPFKGTLKVKVLGTFKDNQKEEYPVYCNSGDGMFRSTTTIDNYSENNWTINKVGKNSAHGNVEFNIHEEKKIDEEDACHKCESGKQGIRTYSENTTSYSSMSGLSKESESNGVKIDDARVTITFLDNGTYTIRIKAASTQGQLKTKKEIIAHGQCDYSTDPPVTTTNKIDAGLNEVLGPFTGNGQDKTLSHSDVIKKTNPVSKEETTIEYEYTLTRD